MDAPLGMQFNYIVDEGRARQILQAEARCESEGFGGVPIDLLHKIFATFPELADQYKHLRPTKQHKVINITAGAIKELKRVKEEQELAEDSIVRVGVRGGGCSGFMYDLGFDELENYDPEKDNLIEFDDFNVVVDKRSEVYLDGTTLDWVDDLSQRGFKFNNPQAQRSCGCGNSFSN